MQATAEIMDRDVVEQFLRGYARLLEAHRESGADLAVSQAAELIGFATPVPAPAPAVEAELEAETEAEAEQALITVTAEANGLAHVDPADSYVTAGGRVLRLPRVLADLHDLGWAGVTLDHLAGASPLRAVASRLTRSSQMGNPR